MQSHVIQYSTDWMMGRVVARAQQLPWKPCDACCQTVLDPWKPQDGRKGRKEWEVWPRFELFTSYSPFFKWFKCYYLLPAACRGIAVRRRLFYTLQRQFTGRSSQWTARVATWNCPLPYRMEAALCSPDWDICCFLAFLEAITFVTRWSHCEFLVPRLRIIRSSDLVTRQASDYNGRQLAQWQAWYVLRMKAT